MTITLSPACSWVSRAARTYAPLRLTATISAPRGRCKPPSVRSSERRVRLRAGIRAAASRPPANTSASMAPGAVTIRSMSAASCASGQTMRLMPKARQATVPRRRARKSSRDTKQMVCGLAQPAGQRAGHDVDLVETRCRRRRTSAPATPARASTSALVPLPSRNSTSSDWKTSATSGSWSMTTTSWSAARALASADPTCPPPTITIRMNGARVARTRNAGERP